MMRAAFTLVELLVVLAIMTVVMGVVVPQGSKMLQRYDRHLQRLRQEQNLSQLRARSFLELREFNITVGSRHYRTTVEGVAHAVRDDHR